MMIFSCLCFLNIINYDMKKFFTFFLAVICMMLVFRVKNVVAYLVPMISMLIGSFRIRLGLMAWGSLISSFPVRNGRTSLILL